MKEKMYNNKMFYIVAVLYLVFPFTLKYIFALIIYIYERTMKFFGMHEKIYTYSDYVRASNIENIYTAPVPSVLDQRDIINGYRKFATSSSNENLKVMKLINYIGTALAPGALSGLATDVATDVETDVVRDVTDVITDL